MSDFFAVGTYPFCAFFCHVAFLVAHFACALLRTSLHLRQRQQAQVAAQVFMDAIGEMDKSSLSNFRNLTMPATAD